jgi:hypothetical protein
MRRPNELPILRSAALPLLLVALAGCGPRIMPMQVFTAFGPGVKFDAAAATYAWAPTQTAAVAELARDLPQLKDLIVSAIDDQFAAKGYELLTEGALPPDFVVSVDQADREEQVDPMTFEAYYMALLALKVTDPRTGFVMYRGAAHIRVNLNAPPEIRKATIEEAVRRILEPFPPRGQMV